jgi:thiol-disulfide isomerase/thioredoxin
VRSAQLAAALLITGCAQQPAMAPPPEHAFAGAEAPLVLKHHLSGAEATLPGLAGHVVLLNFWATWCRPCLLEIPVLARVAADYGEKVLFVAVYHEEEAIHREAVTEWLTHQPEYFPHHVTWGNPALLARFPHRFLPTTYVIGPHGQMSAKLRGAILGKREAELRAAIERALEDPGPASP